MSFGNFDQMLAGCNSAFDVFNEDVWIVYRPKGGTSTPGLPRPIRAIIDRSPPVAIEPGKQGASYKLIISVRNSSADGICAAELDAEIDRIDVPAVLGGPPVTFGFSREKFEHDGGRLSIKII